MKERNPVGRPRKPESERKSEPILVNLKPGVSLILTGMAMESGQKKAALMRAIVEDWLDNNMMNPAGIQSVLERVRD